MKKYFIMTLIMAVALLMVACGAESKESKEKVSAILADEKEIYYTIISPSGKETEAKHISDLMVKTFNAEYDSFKNLFIGIKDSAEADGTAFEILIGETNRAETAEAAKEIGANGWIVKIIGSKIVVYGNTFTALQTAFRQFMESLTYVEGKSLICELPASGIKDKGSDFFFHDKNVISDYCIIAGEENMDAAKRLQRDIKKVTDVTLDIKGVDAAKSEKEIVLGDCGRSIKGEKASEYSLPYECVIKTHKKKILIAGIDSQAISYAAEWFAINYFGISTNISIPEKLDFNSSEYSDLKPINREEGADIRVMSFNVLAEVYNELPPIEGRHWKCASAIYTYAPDVIALQELTPRWNTRLCNMLGEEYCIEQLQPGASASYTLFAYNTNTLELLDSGSEYYKVVDNANGRLITWGFFKVKASGKTCVIISTHLGLTVDKRLSQVEDLAAKITELEEKYEAPVIIAGDYNCTRDSEEFVKLMSMVPIKEAGVSAANIVNDPITDHPLYTVKHGTGQAIDHITYTAGAEALSYQALEMNTILHTSDHLPILSDFAIK